MPGFLLTSIRRNGGRYDHEFRFPSSSGFLEGHRIEANQSHVEGGGQYLYDVIMEESHAMENLGAFIKSKS